MTEYKPSVEAQKGEEIGSPSGCSAAGIWPSGCKVKTRSSSPGADAVV